MRKTVFIITHVGSGYEILLSTLLENPRIFPISNFCWNNYSNLHDIISVPVKHGFYNKATYFLDCVIYNHLFSAYDSFNTCNFIYFIDEPKFALPRIINEKKTSNITSCQRYYLYRLRRICEMAKRTKNAIFLTSKDIYKPETYKIIENYLNLSEKLEIPILKPDHLSIDCLPQNIIDYTESAYEKYLYFAKQQNLIFVS